MKINIWKHGIIDKWIQEVVLWKINLKTKVKTKLFMLIKKKTGGKNTNIKIFKWEIETFWKWEYCLKSLYNQFENLNFLRKYKLTKLSLDELEKMNKLTIMGKNTEKVIKELFQRKMPDPVGFMGELFPVLREQIIPMLHSLFPKLESASIYCIKLA